MRMSGSGFDSTESTYYLASPNNEVKDTFLYPLITGSLSYLPGYSLRHRSVDNFMLAYIREGELNIKVAGRLFTVHGPSKWGNDWASTSSTADIAVPALSTIRHMDRGSSDEGNHRRVYCASAEIGRYYSFRPGIRARAANHDSFQHEDSYGIEPRGRATKRTLPTDVPGQRLEIPRLCVEFQSAKDTVR